jgi:hypothetical protein
MDTGTDLRDSMVTTDVLRGMVVLSSINRGFHRLALFLAAGTLLVIGGFGRL